MDFFELLAFIGAVFFALMALGVLYGLAATSNSTDSLIFGLLLLVFFLFLAYCVVKKPKLFWKIAIFFRFK